MTPSSLLQLVEERQQFSGMEPVAPEGRHDLDAVARELAQVRLRHVPARDLAAVLEANAAVLDRIEHGEEVFRVVLVVPGGADDDEVVALPVDAGPVPRQRLDLPAAARKWQDCEFVVDDEARRIAEREESDPAHFSSWDRSRAACSERARWSCRYRGATRWRPRAASCVRGAWLVATHATVPSRAVPRKFVFSSIVVNPVAPSGRFAMQP